MGANFRLLLTPQEVNSFLGGFWHRSALCGEGEKCKRTTPKNANKTMQKKCVLGGHGGFNGGADGNTGVLIWGAKIAGPYQRACV